MSKNLAEMLEYLIKDERKAVSEYAHLYVTLDRIKAPKNVMNKVKAIAEQERNHYFILKDIAEEYFK